MAFGHERARALQAIKTNAEHQAAYRAEERRLAAKWDLEQVFTTQRKRFAAKLAAGEARIVAARWSAEDGDDAQLVEVRR
jgi:hypothetical protein